MSLTHSTNISSVEATNATPSHGCSQRHTDRPPNRLAIQLKIGVQIGMPLSSAPKNVIAVVQCTTRVDSLCRTMWSPTTLSSGPDDVGWTAVSFSAGWLGPNFTKWPSTAPSEPAIASRPIGLSRVLLTQTDAGMCGSAGRLYHSG